MDDEVGEVPPLEPGDLYLYADGRVVIVCEADDSCEVRPLARVIDDCKAAGAAGHQIHFGGEALPESIETLTVIAAHLKGAEGVDLQPFVPATGAPLSWQRGATALMAAASAGDLAVVCDLVNRGEDVNHADDTGRTALHWAAAHNHAEVVEVLVQGNADRTLVNGDGATAAEEAATYGAVESLGLLVDRSVLAPADKPVRFNREHLIYTWFSALPVVAVPALLGLSVAGLVLGVVRVLALIMFALVCFVAWWLPAKPFWTGGAPRRLAGRRLHLLGWTGRRSIDLSRTVLVGTNKVDRAASWTLLLGHPDGTPASRHALRTLGVPASELDEWLRRPVRVVTVHLLGTRDDAVRQLCLALTHDALTRDAARLLPSFRERLREASGGARATIR